MVQPQGYSGYRPQQQQGYQPVPNRSHVSQPVPLPVRASPAPTPTPMRPAAPEVKPAPDVKPAPQQFATHSVVPPKPAEASENGDKLSKSQAKRLRKKLRERKA